MYQEIFTTLLDQHNERAMNGYDPATTPKSQQLVIAFTPITTKREKRLELASAVVGRHLNSFLDLRMGEIDVLLKLLDQPNFIASMKEEI